jgi:hypothetical protein
MKTRGFVTLATGDAHYRKLAANLLRSYRLHTENPLPFALVTDREGPDTDAFDHVILRPGAGGNYLDKLDLFDVLPFDNTIFIDADCLAYGDLNVLFDWFESADDVSCHGRVLPLSDKTGWFDYENLGSLQSQVSYGVGLHGGIYYIRKTEKAKEVFETAKKLAEHYGDYKFRGNFPTPGDEPLIALAMAVHGCRPIPFRPEGICCYWEHRRNLRFDRKGAVLKSTGHRPLLIHWGTRFTKKVCYRLQVCLLKSKEKRNRNG